MNTAEPSALALSLHAAFQLSTHLLHRNLFGITAVDARTPPRDDMNSIVWIVGHTAYWRQHLADLAATSGSVSLAQLEVFRGQVQRPASIPKDHSYSDVVALFEEGRLRLDDAFVTAVRSGGPPAFLARAGKALVHDAYHIGQVSVLRRLAGHSGAI